MDVDEPPRITAGTGKPDAPFEIASSESEDESPAKRAKPAPVTIPPTYHSRRQGPARDPGHGERDERHGV